MNLKEKEWEEYILSLLVKSNNNNYLENIASKNIMYFWGYIKNSFPNIRKPMAITLKDEECIKWIWKFADTPNIVLTVTSGFRGFLGWEYIVKNDFGDREYFEGEILSDGIPENVYKILSNFAE